MTDYQTEFNAIRAELDAPAGTPAPLADALCDWAGRLLSLEYIPFVNDISRWVGDVKTPDFMASFWCQFGRHAPICEHGASVALTLPWPVGYWQHIHICSPGGGSVVTSAHNLSEGKKDNVPSVTFDALKHLSLALTLACKAAHAHAGEI